MDEATLRDLDHNLAVANQAYTATSQIGDVAEDRDAWLWCCGLPVAEFNIVFPKTPLRDLDACLARGEAFFGPRGLPWRVMLRAEHARIHAPALATAGFEEKPGFPGMVLDPLPEAPKAPPELTLRDVEGPGDLAHFCDTAFRGFGLPVELAAKFITAGFLERPQVALCLGMRKNEPVCTAATVVSGDWIGIYWVATPEAFRGRGYGEAATWAAIAAGQRLGGRRACLQASKLGRPVYERMGFSAPTDYVQFQHAG